MRQPHTIHQIDQVFVPFHVSLLAFDLSVREPFHFIFLIADVSPVRILALELWFYQITARIVAACGLRKVGDAGPFVLFYTSNLDKPSPKPADPVADLKGMAKGMFKKILG